jgi:PTS system N-acetylglucosamine-specific IIC component
MDVMSRSILGAGDVGLFAYGVLNRALIVTGLHHIINNLAWFLVGDYNGVTGDLKRFMAGDPTAGAFMSGFFPVMMFGLPAACLAMYHAAAPEKRAAVGGLFASMALTSFLTGVTEPIEFTFMFLAPALYAVHAVLTGVAMALMHVLDIHLGFGFSAGLFDYVLNFSRATHPLLLIPVGAAYAVIYYVAFRWVIRAFNLKTPGREADEGPAPSAQPAAARGQSAADGFITALGGAANLVTVDACTTRLRLLVKDQQAVNVDALKRLGARGVVRPSANALQVVLGPIADQVAGDIRKGLNAPPPSPSRDTPAPAAPAATVAASSPTNPFDREIATRLLAALGGKRNITGLSANSTRVRIGVSDPRVVDESALRGLGLRGVAHPTPNSLHLVIGPEAEAALAALAQP